MHKINAKATSYIEPTFENHALEWQLLGSEKWKTLWNWGLNKNATIIACSYIKNICCHMHGAWPQICIADQNPFEPQDISLLNIFIGLSSLDIGDWRGWWAETRTCTCILVWTYGMKKVHNYIFKICWSIWTWPPLLCQHLCPSSSSYHGTKHLHRSYPR